MKPILFLFVLFLSLTHTTAADLQLPPFLPDYYRPLFNNGEHPLTFSRQQETNGITQFVYLVNANEGLSIENFVGDSPASRTAFNNILSHLNQGITANKGNFNAITETEFHGQMVLTNITLTFFVFILPHGVNIWTHSITPTAHQHFELNFEKMLAVVNRHRYEDALREGNISLGYWQKAIHAHAKNLLTVGNKREAIPVLQNLLATSPFDYEGHFELIENTTDRQAATNSAKAVFKNAENPDQISRAAKFLGIPPPDTASIPALNANDTGLQVILIPLPPCNPWLLDDVAKVYERITDVPVKIRQLDQKWTWGAPERIAYQREVERILVQINKQTLSFTNWNRDRYVSALTNALNSQDALSKYQGRDLLAKIDAEPGQYRVGPYVEGLSRLIALNQSKDPRTMYVGITEANIFGDNDNYVFSVSTFAPQSHAGVMSYYMMQGKATLSFDSRPRLIERIAKELVPASLKQLRIPRSSDPACPYSYSSGVERMDQKTLNLSDEVKQALTNLKAASPN
jgi:predicted Zn-dependent protease